MSDNRVLIDVDSIAVSYPTGKNIFSRHRYWTLTDISFSLLSGETLGIIGRNGVGKSTLLRVCAGMILPDRGTVVNHGASVSLLSLQAGFISHLSGRENAILSGMLMGMKRSDVRDKLDSIAEYSGLGDFFYEPVNIYSTGMRARLGFAVANQVDPDVLLIDETIGVGDAEFRKKSTSTMKAKIRSNRTFILVSHDVRLIGELCDRVLWIENGTVRSFGEAGEVLEQYRTGS